MDYAEIEKAVQWADPCKAPGPDGFNAHFYKVCWPIVAKDASDAIQDFFLHSGKLLRQVKNAFIALIPKQANLTSPAEFRPISLNQRIVQDNYQDLGEQAEGCHGQNHKPKPSSFQG